MEQSIFKDKKILITGGCGFIGSHFIDRIMNDIPLEIIVIDNLLSIPDVRNIEKYLELSNFHLYQEDLRNVNLDKLKLKGTDVIIHLAAQTSVPISVNKPVLDFETNVVASMKLLEFARKNNIMEFVFSASGGTMYGNAREYPTKETHSFTPISNYGASKAAFEMYLSSFADLYGLKTTSLRLGNVFGPRSLHGVIHDFYLKLKKYQNKLEILGNGNQTKAYLFIDDCVNGFYTTANRPSDGFQAFNMSSEDVYSVIDIADIMCEFLDLAPEYSFTQSEKGWKGDVVYGNLDTSKLQKLGWKESINLRSGIEIYLKWLKNYYG